MLKPSKRSVCIFCQHGTPLRRSNGASIRSIATDQVSERHTQHPPSPPSKIDEQELLRTLRNQFALHSPLDSLRSIVRPERLTYNPNRDGLLRWTQTHRKPLRHPKSLINKAIDEAQEAAKQGRRVRDETFDPIKVKIDLNNVVEVPEVVSGKAVRMALRAQLALCRYPTDILHVLVVAMQNKWTKNELAKMTLDMKDAFFRMRENNSDTRVLATINTVIHRLRKERLPVDMTLMTLGLKFAARSRNLAALKRYLKEFKDRDLPFNSNLFKSVLAKLSIGENSPGEKRNGRWTQEDLMQVLFGFNDLPEGEREHHLGSFVNRNKPFRDQLMIWIAVLSYFGLKEEVWLEWKMWRYGPERWTAQSSNEADFISKADEWFVKHLLNARDPERAWVVVKESGLRFDEISSPVRSSLLEHSEYATFWNDQTSEAMQGKYVEELAKIEAALGVKWVSDGQDGGYHVVAVDLEQALERLAQLDFRSSKPQAPTFGRSSYSRIYHIPKNAIAE